MKNEKSPVITGVLFSASLILLIYTLLELRDKLAIVLGASAFFLVMMAVVLTNLTRAWKSYQQKQGMLLESRMSEMLNQVMNATEENRKHTKANTFYTKKIGEALAGFEDELLDNQRRNNMMMQRMISTQTKSTKVLVKYNEINANKIVSGINSQYQQMEQSFDNGMQNANSELRRIGENIIKIQSAPQPMMYSAMPMMPQVPPVAPPMPDMMAAAPTPVMPEMPTAAPAPEMPDAMREAEMDAALSEAEDMLSMLEETQPAVAEEPVAETQPAAEEQPSEGLDMDAFEAALNELTAEEPVAEEQPAAVEEPVAETQPAAVEEPAAEAAPEITTMADLPDDPNAQLSPDQIAALFASASSAAAETPEPEPIPVKPAATDNGSDKLSQDDIAALFASMGDGAAVEEPEPEVPAAEDLTAAAGLSDDPNAQLSPDQIAALFAAAQG